MVLSCHGRCRPSSQGLLDAVWCSDGLNGWPPGNTDNKGKWWENQLPLFGGQDVRPPPKNGRCSMSLVTKLWTWATQSSTSAILYILPTTQINNLNLCVYCSFSVWLPWNYHLTNILVRYVLYCVSIWCHQIIVTLRDKEFPLPFPKPSILVQGHGSCGSIHTVTDVLEGWRSTASSYLDY